jgi:Asp-tRNA(Asn)/Glu-tRNA(Gln) amidotransferase A subunit family amidase
LPVAIQLTGAMFEEAELLRVARWCEEAIGFAAMPPAAPL